MARIVEPGDFNPESPEPLDRFTERLHTPQRVDWYRTPLPSGASKRLHERSDLRGALQTLGYLGILVSLGFLAIFASFRWPWWIAVALLLCYGTVASFLINGVHELLHGTVFKTRGLNALFCHILAFPGWLNHEHFQATHKSHHRHTLHPPDDIEIPKPAMPERSDFWKACFFNYRYMLKTLRKTLQVARWRFNDYGEDWAFPKERPEVAWPTVRWARFLIVGHAAIITVSLLKGWWMVPLVVSFGSFIANGLFWLCNFTQHLGLPEHNPDFRLCCRSFTLNPFVEFLYWHMNFHIEHHMYAAIPCYNLAQVHAIIKDDLPPTPDGISAVWKEIWPILDRQRSEPGWVYTPSLPSNAGR